MIFCKWWRWQHYYLISKVAENHISKEMDSGDFENGTVDVSIVCHVHGQQKRICTIKIKRLAAQNFIWN